MSRFEIIATISSGDSSRATGNSSTSMDDETKNGTIHDDLLSYKQ